MDRDKKNKINWSNRRFRQQIINTRKYLWHDDAINRIAAWIGLKGGMSVVDVGCGMAYLGHTYWKYIKKGGTYIGIDNDAKMLKTAKQATSIWTGRKPVFVNGDAYNLPLRDNSVDCAMCQTLLLWLKGPKRAIGEMVRVVKPGGVVVCLEPDNTTESDHSSLPELTLKEKLISEKYLYIWRRGRMKLGQGDYSIGKKVPHLMKETGLTNIDARINDMVHVFEPPHDTPLQKHLLKMLKKIAHISKKDLKFWKDLEKRQYIAGGGTLREFNRMMKWGIKRRSILKKQVEDHSFFYCNTSIFYIIKGQKARK